VLGEEFVRYWTTLGGPRKIRKLRAEEGVPTPLYKSQGIVEAPDLVTREKAVVLRNAGSRYNVEVADFTRGNSLPIFSLIFTEFESEGFLFHTTWQWEGGSWRERASSVWDSLTLEMLDWEVPATIMLRSGRALTRHGDSLSDYWCYNPGALERARLHKAEYPVYGRS
jgi:hypothetical protein